MVDLALHADDGTDHPWIIGSLVDPVARSNLLVVRCDTALDAREIGQKARV